MNMVVVIPVKGVFEPVSNACKLIPRVMMQIIYNQLVALPKICNWNAF